MMTSSITSVVAATIAVLLMTTATTTTAQDTTVPRCLEMYTITDEGRGYAILDRKSGELIATDAFPNRKDVFALEYSQFHSKMFGLKQKGNNGRMRLIEFDQYEPNNEDGGKVDNTNLMRAQNVGRKTDLKKARGLAANPETGTLYTYADGNLYTLDATTGKASRVARLGTQHDIVDLTFSRGEGALAAAAAATAEDGGSESSSGDVIYATDGTQLFEIRLDAADSPIESMNVVMLTEMGESPDTKVTGLAASPNTGILYGMVNDGNIYHVKTSSNYAFENMGGSAGDLTPWEATAMTPMGATIACSTVLEQEEPDFLTPAPTAAPVPTPDEPTPVPTAAPAVVDTKSSPTASPPATDAPTVTVTTNQGGGGGGGEDTTSRGGGGDEAPLPDAIISEPDPSSGGSDGLHVSIPIVAAFVGAAVLVGATVLAIGMSRRRKRRRVQQGKVKGQRKSTKKSSETSAEASDV